MAVPLRVVFASVHAGGGHNTVRDALVRSVARQDPHQQRVVPVTWTAASGFDTFYRFCVRWHLQGLIFWMTTFSLAAWAGTIWNPRLMLEVLALLRAQKPDMVVSTHVQLTGTFLVARWLLRSKVRILNVIPDYGEPTPGFFPRFRAARPDATLVNGPDTWEFLQTIAEPNEVFRIGTLVSDAFEDLGSSQAMMTRAPSHRDQWRRELAEAFPDLLRLDASKPIVTFFGGSGFASGCRPVIDRLIHHPELGTKFSMVVLAGRDAAFESELNTLHGGKPGFFVLGFLPHPLLARLYALTDVPVMGSIAHSTLQEMLEMRCGPLLVHRVIPGTEPPYLAYLEKERLGLYEPDADAMSALVLEAVGVTTASLPYRSLKQGFATRAARIRHEHKQLAPRFIQQLELSAGRQPQSLPATVAVGARSISLDEMPSTD